MPIAGQEWQATIDTGFNGDLELPYALGSSVKPQFFGRGLSLLAGGQSIEEGSFVGRYLHNLLAYDLDLRVFTVSYIAFALLVVATFILAPPRWRKRPAQHL